jgi:hypothetical protein
MSFIVTYWLRAELSKPAIMEFLARVPAEQYLLIPRDNGVYGVVVSDEVMEFFTNECSVKALEVVPAAQVRQLAAEPGARVWGTRELLTL